MEAEGTNQGDGWQISEAGYRSMGGRKVVTNEIATADRNNHSD